MDVIIRPREGMARGVWYPDIDELRSRSEITVRVLSNLVTGDHRHPVTILVTVGDMPRGRGSLWPSSWKYDATEELVITTKVEARQGWSIIVTWEGKDRERQVGARIEWRDL